jgi:hypothetical protein
MPTLPNMGLITPTGHGSEDVWDTILESLFTLVDEHDHSSGKGVKVPSSGLNINADVAWNSGGTYYAITGIKALDFQPSLDSAMSAFACALYVDSDDNELYWRTAGGVNVRVTDTNSLNVGSFTGGIGGDYATTTALLDYDDATDTYRLRQELSGGVRQYAKIGVADIVLREYDPAGDLTVPVETITIKSPDALAAAYTMTLPAAVPASTSLMQMSSTGAVLVSNTPPSLNGLTLDNNTDLTLQGTGHLKHGEYTVTLPVGPSAFASVGSLSYAVDGIAAGVDSWELSSGGVCAWYAPHLMTGWRLKFVAVRGVGPASVGNQLTVTIQNDRTSSTKAHTESGDFNTAYQVVAAIDTPYTVAAGDVLRVDINPGAGVCDLHDVILTFDRPV